MLQFVSAKFPPVVSPLVALNTQAEAIMSDPTNIILEAPEAADSSMTVDGEVHTVVSSDAEYELTVHPAFASACTVASNGGAARDLFRQNGTHQLNGKEIPKRHTIRLKSRSGKKDVTLTLNDAGYSVKKITIELYKDSHDPTKAGTTRDSDLVFTVENDAKLCPPTCDPT
jgi:hypothetical protein